MELSEKEFNELEKYSRLERSEIGEVNDVLFSLNNYKDYVSDEFVIALEKELKEQLENFRSSCKIIKKKVIREVECEALEWDF